MVYAKPPFGGPEAVLAYLSRYTHRVAISNNGAVACAECCGLRGIRDCVAFHTETCSNQTVSTSPGASAT